MENHLVWTPTYEYVAKKIREKKRLELVIAPYIKREALKTQGCGMDMAFDAVYTLGSSLWPLGTPTPHSTRNGEPDTCGGYALNHRSLG